jgi:hypothetical protein
MEWILILIKNFSLTGFTGFPEESLKPQSPSANSPNLYQLIIYMKLLESYIYNNFAQSFCLFR